MMTLIKKGNVYLGNTQAVPYTLTSYNNNTGKFWECSYKYLNEPESFIPKQIIIREDSKTTIVIWEDDSKTIVHCSEDETFVPEFGIAMATMNKIYGNRTKFKKFINEKTLELTEKDVENILVDFCSEKK